jgi:hypothetical protein
MNGRNKLGIPCRIFAIDLVAFVGEPLTLWSARFHPATRSCSSFAVFKPAHRPLDPLRQKGPRCHGGVRLGRFSTVSPRVRRDAIRFNRWLTRWA